MHHDNDNRQGKRFISICSGIEAASVAFKPLGWKAVAFSEIEPAPCSVLAHHYPDVPNHGDMTKFKEWPDYGKDGSEPIDLVCGGTPCQAFSVAGLREGLNDPRGNLSLTFLAIVDKYRPEWVLFENVPGILSSATHVSPDPRPPEIELDGGDGPGDGEEVVVSDEYEADESHAFSCFLAGLSELGYGVAYRVIDAQYVRVDGFERAVPQRRRRVFVVGYLGDWRRAAAVLLEPESMSGNPAPSRKAGQKPAPTLSARTQGGGGLGTDFELDGGLVPAQAFGGGNTAGSIDVAACLTAKGQRIDFEVETFVAGPVADTLTSNGDAHSGFPEAAGLVASTIAPAITRNPYGDNESREGLLVAHTLKGEGFDASEDGTGRGTPIVPVSVAIRGREDGGTIEMGDDVAHALRASQGGGDKPHVLAPVGYNITPSNSNKDYNAREAQYAQAVTTQGGAPSARGGDVLVHAIQAGALRANPASGPDGVGVQADVAYTLEARAEVQAVQSDWAVRRLTPVECARLQGFPDDYLSQVIHNGKPLADGPMYKGLGNSWPVNSVRWIGRRIQMVEEIAAELDAANDNHQSNPAARSRSHA